MIGEVQVKNSTVLIGELGTKASIVGDIESGATILGDISTRCIIGEVEVAPISIIQTDAEQYDGNYEVTPTSQQQTLQTKDRLMNDDIEIKPIPYYDVSNEFGRTIYIGGNVNA